MKSRIHIQFAKFFTVGILNTGVDWVIFFALTLLPVLATHRPLAKAISFLVAVTNSFFLNSYWTFRKEYHAKMHDTARARRNRLQLFVRFVVVSGIGWVFNITIFSLGLATFSGRVAPRIADVLSLAVASGFVMGWNFLGNKFWTYTARAEKPAASPQERAEQRMFVAGAAFLIALQIGISFFVMRGDSATIDEVAHIADGYSIVQHQDYRFNPEHPPLMKVLAAAPLQLLNLNDITAASGWDEQNQWKAGRAFLYFIGNDADRILFFARLPVLLLLLLLSVYVVRFAAELFDRKVALVVLFFFALTPELLGHGHLVTTDVGAALGFVAATYHLWHFLQKRTAKNLIIAGVALGIAQLLKFSCVILIPIDLVLIVVWCLLQKQFHRVAFWRNMGMFLWQYVVLGVIGLLLVWAVYIPCTWNTPVAVEHELIDRLVTYDAEWVPSFRDKLHVLEAHPVTRGLGHYAMGVYLVFQRVDGGNSTFILGYFDEKSIWWFFPVAWFIKTALPVLALFFASVGIAAIMLWRKPRSFDRIWRVVMLATPIVVYWVITLYGSLNLGIRHLMPTVPFVLLFTGEVIAVLLATRSRVRIGILATLMVWMAISIGMAYPYYLGYFNELTYGIPKYELLVDSSLDWGQDLKRLATYVEDNHIDNLYVDYFGGGQPDYYLSNITYWHSSDGPVEGYIAVSSTFYQFSRFYGKIEGKWSYDWLRPFTPVATIGDSILLFHVTAEDLRAHPPVSPYPITQPPEEYVIDPANFVSQ